jgi:enolase-phosphatase E1
VASELERTEVVLLDIEGTTTPIAFVHERLFGYIRERLDSFLAANWAVPSVQAAVRQLAAESPENQLADRQLVAAHVRSLMDKDSKSPGLKTLQGLVWHDAYTSGKLRGEVFPDVPPAMKRWHAEGLRIAIYSSGSALAQRLLFASTGAGDLTSLIDAFFDTAVGGKKQADSYRKIAATLGCAPSAIVFLSDVTEELTAASEAGCAVRLCVRAGNTPQRDADRFQSIATFDDLRR